MRKMGAMKGEVKEEGGGEGGRRKGGGKKRDKKRRKRRSTYLRFDVALPAVLE